MMVFVRQIAASPTWFGGTSQSMDDQSFSIFDIHADIACPAETQRARRTGLLNEVVGREILPRLARARRGLTANQTAAHAIATTEGDTQELVRLLVRGETTDIMGFIEALRRRGVTAESLYIGILPDAARCLGVLWQEDRSDFLQVTIGLGHLQHVARTLSPEFQADAPRGANTAGSILLLPAPNEQHTLGLLILAEFFRRSGWHVAGGPVSAGVGPAGMVRRAWFDVVGFSVASEDRTQELAQCIHRVRRASRNPTLGVMVGGPLFLAHPELVARLGADSAAVDAPGAVRQASDLMKIRYAAD